MDWLDEEEETLVVVEHRATLATFPHGDVLTINSPHCMLKVPAFLELGSHIFLFFWCRGALYQLLSKLIYYGFADLSDNERICIVRNPEAKV